jgi:hypothetical protein
MMSEEHDNAFVDGMRKLLDETEPETDSRVRMRLRSARLKALEAAEEQVPWYLRFPRLITAGTFATAVVIAVSLWIVSERGNLPTGQVEDIELLTTKEQMELYKDLDFYRWLETSEHAG